MAANRRSPSSAGVGPWSIASAHLRRISPSWRRSPARLRAPAPARNPTRCQRRSPLPEPDHADEAAGLGQTEVVAPPLEPHQVPLDLVERLDLADVRVQQQPDEHPPHAGARLQHGVADRPGAARPPRSGRPPPAGCPTARAPTRGRAGGRDGAGPLPGGGPPLATAGSPSPNVPVRERAATGRGEPFGRRRGDGSRRVVHRPELGLVAVRVFEVVADDLLELGDAVARLAFEPAGEALVQLRPRSASASSRRRRRGPGCG